MRNILSSRGVLPLSYHEKYETNKKWAESAYTEKDYDVAVNRYYYSIFQGILHILAERKVSVKRVSGEGSHNLTAEAFVNEFFGGQKAFRDRSKFNADFQLLKKIRCEGDYDESHINSFRAKDAKTAYESIKKLLNK